MVLQSVSTKPVITSSWSFEPVAKEMSLFSYSDAAEAVLPYHVVMCTTFHYIAIGFSDHKLHSKMYHLFLWFF